MHHALILILKCLAGMAALVGLALVGLGLSLSRDIEGEINDIHF